MYVKTVIKSKADRGTPTYRSGSLGCGSVEEGSKWTKTRKKRYWGENSID